MKALLIAAVLAVLAARAQAQTAVGDRPAFSVERFTPAPGNARFLGVEEPDVPAAGRWVVTTSTWLASRLIVLRSISTGDESTVPVALRWGQEVSVARGLGSRFMLGLAVPSAVQWGDRLQGIGLSERALDRVVLGDVRLHGRARIAGAPGARGLAAAIAGTITLPTGDDGDFAGEAGWMLGWGLRVGYRTPDVVIAGGAGLRVRTREVVLLSPARPHGNELTGNLGVAVRAAPLGRQFGSPDRAWLLAEVEGVLGDDPGTGSRGPSPAEARLGVRIDVAHCWSVAVAGGGGFTPDDISSPGYRFLAQVTFHQDPVGDRDGDGVPDGRDACWKQPEDRDGVDDWDGCPDDDDDGDGIQDTVDACPGVPEDLDGYHDADGCPEDETIFSDRKD